ncbi:hypothetical protein [Croceivirga sp. JEA036]|uniref:hypothetical protein n=1 Tax=Croceivirga sp. JEA036 TaxID=2721162 RepID=UPI00143A5F4F|nr:hypothetical protein [Croceivirga sp. JEA036]NJB34980.1 hypothetical protein [Croceivirga sp. JEA036]
MRKLFLIISSFCFLLGNAQIEQDSLRLKEDTGELIMLRELPTDIDSKYNGEEFDYSIKTGESQNFLDRFFRWLGGWLQDNFGIDISPEFYKFMEISVYVLMGALIIYLFVRLFINEKFNTIFIKKARALHDIELAEQHIETLDFDVLLKKAIAANDYRLAIRYHFLRFLKTLSQRELIDWHFEKTNADYRIEIKEARLKAGFSELAYLYDYIWYGEQYLDHNGYQSVAKKFHSINQIIPQ